MRTLTTAATNVTALALLGLLLARVITAIYFPLVDDETYYALWSRHLDLGYYDHPPAIAWFIAAGTFLFGESAFGVRAATVAAGTAVVALTWRICQLATDNSEIALRAAYWLSLMPLFTVAAGVAATPDAPSTLLWTVALWALVELHYSGNPRWWLVVGLSVGLGVMSKLTNVTLPAGIVMYVLLTSNGRTWLKCSWLWLGGALAIVVASPYLWWNLSHDWIGLQRQVSRLSVEVTTPIHMIKLVIAQSMLLTPIIAAYCLMGLFNIKSHVRTLISYTSCPLLALMVWHSFTTQVQDNWLVPLYPGLAVIAAIAAGSGNYSRWMRPAASVVAITLALSVYTIALSPLSLKLGNDNVINQGRGWSELGEQVAANFEATNARWISVGEYALTGQASFHLPQYTTWQVSARHRYLYREAFPPELCNQRGLYLSRTHEPERVKQLFEVAEFITAVPRIAFGQEIGRLSIWSVRHPKAATTGFNCAAIEQSDLRTNS